MMKQPTYQYIARQLTRVENLRANPVPAYTPEGVLNELHAWVRKHGPSGSGIDTGTQLDATSQSERLVFNASFHHMDEHGCYAGWTNHRIIVKPSLVFGLDLHITGPDRNEIKEYLHQTFEQWLNEEVEV